MTSERPLLQTAAFRQAVAAIQKRAEKQVEWEKLAEVFVTPLMFAGIPAMHVLHGRSPSSTVANRRQFLRRASAARAASLAAAPLVLAGERVKGANERLGVGFIGTGGRAQAHIDICLRLKAAGRCETVAVCDVYAPRVQAAAVKTGGKIYRNHKVARFDKAKQQIVL